MKRLNLIIESIFHKRKGREAWNKTNYCLVLGYKHYEIPYVLGEGHCYNCAEFESREEAEKYLDNNVSKSDRKYCKLYKLLKS